MENREGRKPAVYWFNPNCEGQVALNRRGFTPTRLLRSLERDLETLPMFLCAPGDVVLVRERPSAAFLCRMEELGFITPEFVEYPPEGLTGLEIATRKIGELRPWGWSPESVAFMEPLGINLPAAETPVAGTFWNDGIRRLYSKAWSADLLRSFLVEHSEEWLCDERVVGTACVSVEEVMEQLARLKERGVEEAVVKAIFGSSGQNQIRLFDGELRGEQTRWLQHILRDQGCAVVEPLLNKIVDLSLHLDIKAPGKAAVRGWTRFLTDRRGQYRGTLICDALTGRDIETREFLYGGVLQPRWSQRISEMLADHLAKCALDSGYIGPVGIDALIYREENGLRLKPIVEVNPRSTMGQVALQLSEKVDSTRAAVWLTLGRKDIEAAGFASVAEFAKRMESRFPLERMPDGTLLNKGVLFTTDPHQGQAFATLLLLGESLEMCREYLAGFPKNVCAWMESC